MKSKFWLKLGLLSLTCGMVSGAPALISNAADTTNLESTATLTLDSSDTHLSLDAVPSFPFSTVKTSDILSGKAINTSLTSNNQVTVTDTRLDSKGWDLAVTSTAFTNSGKKITGNLAFNKPGAFAFSTADGKTIDGDGAAGWTWASPINLALLTTSSTQVASSTGAKEGTASASINSATFTANSHDALATGTYTSTLTWNLTATPNPGASE